MKAIFNSLTEFLNSVMEPKPEKVAILVSVLSSYEGGGRHAQQQAKELSNEFQTKVFTFERKISSIDYVAIETILPNYEKFYKYGSLKFILKGSFLLNIYENIKYAKKLSNYDVIIVNQSNLMPLAFITKALYGTKVIFYNLHPYVPNNLLIGVQKIYRPILDRIFSFFIGTADYILSISIFSRDKLKERFKLDSYVIYIKTDQNRFNAHLNGNIIRERLKIGNDPMVLFVGRIIPYKGIHLLIECWKKSLNEIPNLKLVIVGDMPDKNYFKKLENMIFNLDGSVIFTGAVKDEELPYYYSACNIYASCSLWEGFNIPLIEAQASGKTVIAFDIGPHSEIVKRGFLIKEGDLDEFSNAIIASLKNTRICN